MVCMTVIMVAAVVRMVGILLAGVFDRVLN